MDFLAATNGHRGDIRPASSGQPLVAAAPDPPSNQLIEAICQLTDLAEQPADLDQVGSALVSAACTALGNETAGLCLWWEKSHVLCPITSLGPVVDSSSFPSGFSMAGAVFKAGKPLVTVDYASCPDAVPAGINQGIKSGVVVPVKAGPQVIGSLWAFQLSHVRWRPEHARLLTMLSSVAGLGLQAARARERRWQVHLTPRETQILSEILLGNYAKGIAQRNGVSESTVRTHIRSLLTKFGVNSQLTLAAVARDLGFDPTQGPAPEVRDT
jgi:DNA-binding CsgD family transcriptional regulator